MFAKHPVFWLLIFLLGAGALDRFVLNQREKDLQERLRYLELKDRLQREAEEFDSAAQS